jgi:raffinose/stachyose/melibiose transport system substrate-binding protein
MEKRLVRRSLAFALASALAVALLSGCAGSAPASSDTLRILTPDPPERLELLEEQFAIFEEETGISVTAEAISSGVTNFTSKLQTELVGGKGPDLWGIWGGTIGAPFATNGLAADLDPYYEEYDWNSAIPESYVEGMTWDGKKYGVPTSAYALTVFYSKSAFERAGVTATPTTYDELLDVNEKLVASGQVPLGLAGKDGSSLMRLFEYLLEKNAGPELHDELLSGGASWDDPAVVTSLTELKEWEDNGWLPEGVMALDPKITEPGFTQGAFAYTITGSWADAEFIQKASDPNDYSTFALPTEQTPNRHSGWVSGYMINASSANKDNAAKLIDFLTRPDVQAALQNTASTIEGTGPDPEVFVVSAEQAELAAAAPNYTIQDQALPAEVSNAYFSVQSQVIQGEITPEEGAKQLGEAVSQGFPAGN